MSSSQWGKDPQIELAIDRNCPLQLLNCLSISTRRQMPQTEQFVDHRIARLPTPQLCPYLHRTVIVSGVKVGLAQLQFHQARKWIQFLGTSSLIDRFSVPSHEGQML